MISVTNIYKLTYLTWLIPKFRQYFRHLFIDAVKQLNQFYYPGGGSGDPPFPAGHVFLSWFKQDEIHQASHVHGWPAFLPWT